jgi:Predicted membrane protein (DUF2335)
MTQNEEAPPSEKPTKASEPTLAADPKPPDAPPLADPAADKILRASVEAAIGSVIETERTRAEIVERVVRVVRAEIFRGPLPHPRHLQAYEDACPGLANRIVAMAEKAHSRQEDRLDRAITYEFEDRRLGMRLAFGAGDAPDFVEVGEVGIAMDDAMRRQRRVQLVG